MTNEETKMAGRVRGVAGRRKRARILYNGIKQAVLDAALKLAANKVGAADEMKAAARAYKTALDAVSKAEPDIWMLEQLLAIFEYIPAAAAFARDAGADAVGRAL